MPEITSTNNPRIKYVLKLRNDRKQRFIDHRTLVEGVYELEVALESGIKPEQIFISTDLVDKYSPPTINTVITTVSRPAFEKMSHRENPDGILAIIPMPEHPLEKIKLHRSPFLLLVESVEKPGNLGAIFRSADAAGVDAVIVSDPRVDLFNPSVIRASRGTVFSVPCAVTTNEVGYQWLVDNRISILAATPQGMTTYTNVDMRRAICLAVGTEDRGLSEFWLTKAEQKIMIPMAGKVNSLNVSTSTAILLYEAIRQRTSTFSGPN